MGSWLNSDGLYIKYGPTETVTSKAGEYADANYYGSDHFVEIDFSYSDLSAFGTNTIMSDTVVIPGGARITKTEIYVHTAFTSSGSATLTYGLIRTDRSTELDYDGFDATIAKGSLTLGATVAGDGALVNTTLANDGLLTVTAGTANFDTGRGKIRIFWYMP